METTIRFLSPSDYRIYTIFTDRYYSATGGKHNVQKPLKYRSRSTVSKRIRPIVNLGIIRCVNPTEHEKFYDAVSGIAVSPSKETNDLLYGGNKIGYVPYNASVDEIRQRCPDECFISSRRGFRICLAN